MKTKVNGGKAFLAMLVVATAVLLTALPLTLYLPWRYSADATNGSRGVDSQTAEDLGKEEQDESPRGEDSQTAEDLGKEEQDKEEESPQVEGQDAPDNEEEDNSGVLGAEFRGGETTKEGSEIAGAENSEGNLDNLSREELEAELRGGETTKQAPIAVSGENVYTVWWTSDTANGNGEVMFRASIDGGMVFGNKTNLSNTTDADSVDATIDAEGGNIIITWWERNQTINNPVMRVSNDNGATFGPMLVLATNGTLGEASDEEGEE
jgi:hypothetical protein